MKTTETQPQLVRGLNLSATTALVVGTIIGTGIFAKTANMAQQTGTPALVMLAWVVAGLLSLAGALTYAELGAMMPQAGGEYIYMRKAYGDAPAFLFGWMRIVIGSSGSIASYGVLLVVFLAQFFPALDSPAWLKVPITIFGHTMTWEFGVQQALAVFIIMAFTLLNCARVVFGGQLQILFTAAKVGGLGLIIFGVFFFAKSGSWDHLKSAPNTIHCTFSTFGAALLAALWAYDGWNNMPMAAGEVKNPGRNVPLALFFGMAIVLVVYGLTNLAYLYALPFDQILTAKSDAHPNGMLVATMVSASFSNYGPKLVAIAASISIIGVLNGSILTGARIPYAMAKDGLFFPRYANLSGTTAAPIAAIIMQGVWSSVLAVSGTFDQLTDCVVFAGWIFYGATTASVFVLRRKMPNAPRPYKTLWYPVLPLVFVVCAILLLINTLWTNPKESAAGLILIAAGVPIYLWLRKTQKQTTSA